jgi:RecA/RadA recombinase
MSRLDRTPEVIEETRKPKAKPEIARLGFSSGSTLLNLALSDHPDYGFATGKLVNIIGDSSAGKTFLLWTLFAEMAHDKRFDNYDLIYDEPEVALEFNIPKLFGGKTKKRVRTDLCSKTVEEFHDNLAKELAKGRPIVYGLDSFDALSAEAELKRDIREGTYGQEKPKMAGIILRKVCGKIADTESGVFVISQTRDNIGVTFGSKKTRSGGKALRFYSTHEMWLAVEGHIKRRERDVGVDVICKISKNKLTGKLRTIGFPIIYDYGVDNVASMVDFLLDEKVWKKEGRKVVTGNFLEPMGYEALIKSIVDLELIGEVSGLVVDKWREIEESIVTDRPRKYAE